MITQPSAELLLLMRSMELFFQLRKSPNLTDTYRKLSQSLQLALKVAGWIPVTLLLHGELPIRTYVYSVRFDNVPAEILIPSGGMGMVWCYLKPLSTVIRKTTSCLINTENKPQKWRQRVTVLVGTSNSLNTALAIKFLTRLKPLHKDYTTLQFQRLWQLLIHTYTHFCY